MCSASFVDICKDFVEFLIGIFHAFLHCYGKLVFQSKFIEKKEKIRYYLLDENTCQSILFNLL